MRARHVHVVDDDEVIRRFLTTTLSSAGYAVTEASDGHEALASVDPAELDLILLDVRMPGIDGLEVCRQLRAKPATASVPVLMLTALDGPEDVVAGIEAGADEFVTKPIEATVLRARVHALLRAHDRHVSTAPEGFPRMLEARIDGLASTANLTSREREVFTLQLLGRTAEDIATALGITERTARFHTSNVLDKVGADTRLDLFRILLAH